VCQRRQQDGASEHRGVCGTWLGARVGTVGSKGAAAAVCDTSITSGTNHCVFCPGLTLH
jgi:hypothetical protein